MSASFFDCITTSRCLSPQLFSATYRLGDYTLRVAEYGVPDVEYSLGFEVGQRFPWKTTDTDLPPILDLLSGQFPCNAAVLNDAQSFHPSD
ncbi:hypothetical protein ACI65C_007045 [Semiaphis heraclei]